MPLLEQPDGHLGDKVLPNLNKLQGRVHCSIPNHHNIRHAPAAPPYAGMTMLCLPSWSDSGSCFFWCPGYEPSLMVHSVRGISGGFH